MQIMVLRLLKPYCLRRLMYGCEIWPLNAVNVREIDVLWNNGFRHVFNCCWQSFHMQALRRILGIRWYDKVPNAVVNDRTKLPDMPSLIADRRHYYLDTSVAYRRTHLLRRHFNCQ